MSESLFEAGGLRFWDEREIAVRENFIQKAKALVVDNLTSINPAWTFWRVEGPCLHPRSQISESYDEDDIFVTNHQHAGAPLCLRAETTPSSYAYARAIQKRDKRVRPPFCVWQAGKSFRRETNDGASPAKLRYNEFWQLEFQCIYSASTRADYRQSTVERMSFLIGHELGMESMIVESDRLPSYSESTIDIEVETSSGYKEVASCSIRTDYADDMRVFELAIGLDRIVQLSDKF